MRTINDVISNTRSVRMESLPVSDYEYRNSDIKGVGLAVESMKNHMTDEGWQIFQGLEKNGFILAGHNLSYPYSNVRLILDHLNPNTVVVQDKREWEGLTAERRMDPLDRFSNMEILKDNDGLFRVTILKDAHQKPGYFREFFKELDCHAWIVYYHPDIVAHLCGSVRRGHLIRTYHTVDRQIVPTYSNHLRKGIVLSGVLNRRVYPLRTRLKISLGRFVEFDFLSHPGYHQQGCSTPLYLSTLSNYRVSICTTSIYGYALRKIIESTACGCRVVTDLPVDDVLPEIDKNLIRIDASMGLRSIAEIIKDANDQYDPDRQKYLADKALDFYDYRSMGSRLVSSINSMRRSYGHEVHGQG